MERETSLRPLERYLLERVRVLTGELNTLKLEWQTDAYRKARRENEVERTEEGKSIHAPS